VIVIAFVLAAVSAVTLTAGFALVVVGIHLAERHKSLPGASRGCADALARRLLVAGSSHARPGRRCGSGVPARPGRRAAGHVR